MNPPIILIGAGGHARACIDVIEMHGHYQIEGLVGSIEQGSSDLLQYPVIASDKDLERLAKKYQYALISIGQILTAEHRKRLYRRVISLGFTLPIIVSPSAHVSRHATLGAGTIVMHGAVVNSGARVGVNCIVNTKALIEHDATVSDHCHISTGAILNGGVCIGEGSFVGSGSVVKEGVAIGQGCVIGMGVSLRHSIDDYVQLPFGSSK